MHEVWRAPTKPSQEQCFCRFPSSLLLLLDPISEMEFLLPHYCCHPSSPSPDWLLPCIQASPQTVTQPSSSTTRNDQVFFCFSWMCRELYTHGKPLLFGCVWEGNKTTIPTFESVLQHRLVQTSNVRCSTVWGTYLTAKSPISTGFHWKGHASYPVHVIPTFYNFCQVTSCYSLAHFTWLTCPM